MTPGLDTSVVVRLPVGAPSTLADAAWRFIVDSAVSATGPATISDLVVGEAYFALLHHYRVPRADAVKALHGLLADPRVRAKEGLNKALESVFSGRMMRAAKRFGSFGS